MRQYQWLLFDADGTLFDYDRAESAALHRAFQSIGVVFDSTYLAAYRRINKSLWQGLEKGQITPGVIKVRRFEMLFETIGVDHSPAAFGDHYLECLADCSELIAGAAEAVQALRKNYRLAILTNGLQKVQRRRLAGSAIQSHIDELIISEEIGVSKPSRDFFDAALARIGNPSKRELLMIGDNWNADVMGAINYGLDACWYNPGRKPRPGDGKLAREITALGELVAWL